MTTEFFKKIFLYFFPMCVLDEHDLPNEDKNSNEILTMFNFLIILDLKLKGSGVQMHFFYYP